MPPTTAHLRAPGTDGPGLPARAGVLGAASLTLMAGALIAPALPAMSASFGADSETTVRLALTITSLTIAVGAPLAGLVVDRAGARSVLVTALALYAASGTAGLYVTGLPQLLATRAVLGLAVGAVTTAVTALLTTWFTGGRRAAYLGYQQAFASLGGVVLLPLAGILAGAGWRTPFWLYAAAAPLALLVLGFTRARPVAARSDDDAPVAAPAPRAALRTAGVYLVALTATTVFYMAPTQVPFLLDDYAAPPAVVGVAVAASTLTGLLGALAFRRVRAHVPSSLLTASSIGVLGAGWLLVGLAGSTAGVIAGLLVGGVGVGLVVPNLNLRLGELARPDQRGRVLAGLVSAIFLGQFVSPVVAGPLIGAVGIAGAFVWAGLGTVAAALLGAAVTRPRHAAGRTAGPVGHLAGTNERTAR
ncbi:MFS transporter [Promicromonospora thailandica]|uniref:Arabinose efflux permease, MFS family n=1 Tax=Promicromonospora thailandica TaxID=765201 RepID=A0A9X2G5P9_9MICO|nr:MFS transporter [Promicromonospora thailandica]MCP2266038.1 putative arabinose efflux permease, MFS family [Promicromonospora thailandica]